ncbi:MAG: cell division protein FtsZ [Bacteroidetes bacterium 4572_77]|nr:MAG: cell division protein FtsZ [Bacteroidetes bacterium 4572_77]
MLAFDSPKEQSNIIKVLGVGGGGGNAVNHMYKQGIQGVDFILCNTDSQALESSPIPTKIQMGNSLTEGRGAGAKPEVGRNAAIEDIEKIKETLEGSTKMLFITAGMGGGTGTGAAPVIAQAAAELDILTVGIVTIPFGFEGRKRKQMAEAGIQEMRKHVDTILIISNDKLRELHGNSKMSEAFAKADNILATAAKGIAELITVTGYINVDFEDVKTVMQNSGVSIMGSGKAEGENRALEAAEMALNSPLLNDNDIRGASDMLLYITTGVEDEIEMDELTEITEYIIEAAGDQCEVIWGNGTDESLGKAVSITLIATGFHRQKKNPQPDNETTEGGKIATTLYDINSKTETPAKNNTVDTIEEITEIELINGDLRSKPSEHPETSRSETTFPAAQTSPQTERSPYLVRKEEDKSVYNETITSEEEKQAPAKERETSSPQEHEQKLSERTKKLRELSYQPKGNIEEMERIPAYKRKNIHVSHTVTSQESERTRYSLEDNEGETEMRTNNSYLHDNVD